MLGSIDVFLQIPFSEISDILNEIVIASNWSSFVDELSSYLALDWLWNVWHLCAGPRKVEWQTPLRTDGVQMMVIFLVDASAAASLFFFPICSHERTICCSTNVVSFFCAALSSMGTTKWQLHQAFLFPILTYAIDQKTQQSVISSLNSQFLIDTSLLWRLYMHIMCLH